MRAGRGWRGTMVLAGSVLAAGAVQAGGARALGDDELAQAWGRGLEASTLSALTRQDQSASYASADGAFAALGSLSADGTSTLERQTARQQAQSATVGLQQTVRLAQAMLVGAQLVAIAGVVMPVLPIAGLGLALPPTLGGNDGKKH